MPRRNEFWCFQHQAFVEDPQDHLDQYNDHVLVEFFLEEDHLSTVGVSQGQGKEIVAPVSGTATVAISGFLSIEDAINHLITSGTASLNPNLTTPTSSLQPFNTIEDAILSISGSALAGSNSTEYTFGEDVENSSSNYTVKARVLFPGSDSVGSPVSIIIIGFKTGQGGGDGSIKIFDFTNNTTIAEFTTIISDQPSIINMGTISNISTDEAIWEIQLKKSKCDTLSIRF